MARSKGMQVRGSRAVAHSFPRNRARNRNASKGGTHKQAGWRHPERTSASHGHRLHCQLAAAAARPSTPHARASHLQPPRKVHLHTVGSSLAPAHAPRCAWNVKGSSLSPTHAPKCALYSAGSSLSPTHAPRYALYSAGSRRPPLDCRGSSVPASKARKIRASSSNAAASAAATAAADAAAVAPQLLRPQGFAPITAPAVPMPPWGGVLLLLPPPAPYRCKTRRWRASARSLRAPAAAAALACFDALPSSLVTQLAAGAKKGSDHALVELHLGGVWRKKCGGRCIATPQCKGGSEAIAQRRQ